MLRHLGYACLNLSVPESSPRGTVLRNATPDRLRQLIAENLQRLERVLRFNVAHGIRLFRISSDLVPFASHPANQLHWWEEFRKPLAELGALIREGGLRVSMHPGQYTVLSAPRESVVLSSVADLRYHARMLDALGLDGTHKVVVHGGGVYGDKSAAMRRWVAQYRQLPENVRARLVLENDERLYSAEDVLALSAQTGVPVVFDVFHHRVHTGGDANLVPLLRRAFSTWSADCDGVPKIHYSSQASGLKPGAHAEYVEPEEFAAFLGLVPPDLVFDCMLEAKAKDLALFRVRDHLGLTS